MSDIKTYKINLIICASAIFIIVLGFFLMSPPSGTDGVNFNDQIFSFRRIKLAPFVCLFGFLLMILGILYPSKKSK